MPKLVRDGKPVASVGSHGRQVHCKVTFAADSQGFGGNKRCGYINPAAEGMHKTLKVGIVSIREDAMLIRHTLCIVADR